MQAVSERLMNQAKTKIKFLGWPAAILILALIVATEALPFLAGSGNLYIIMHFMIVPFVCLLHLFWNTFGEITAAKRARRQASGANLSSTLVPALYILLLAFTRQPFLKALLG